MAKNTINILLLLVLFLTAEINAGESAAGKTDSIGVVKSTITADTVSVMAQQNPDTARFIMTKSPMGALLRSAVLPGWGQIYNESYWKAPVVWAALGTMAYYWKKNDDKYQNYRALYRQNSSNYNKTYRDFYRDNRDLVALYMGLVYAINLLDAYIDAHMFDFAVDEDPVTSTPMLQMRLNF